MTGHRQPPAEWIPLSVAIAHIREIWTAFEEALAFDGTDYADDVTSPSTWRDDAAGFYPDCFEVMGHSVMVMSNGVHVMPNPNNLDSLDKVYKRVERAKRQAVDRIRQLVDEGYYRLHGRHGSLLADHLPIPTDVVRARKVDFDLNSDTATYADGSTAEFVHLERTDRPSFAQVVYGLGSYNPEPSELEPRSPDAVMKRSPKKCKLWFEDLVLGDPSRKAMHRPQMEKEAVGKYKVSKREAGRIWTQVISSLPLDQAKLYVSGRPRKKSA
jgi:hypothetical protein